MGQKTRLYFVLAISTSFISITATELPFVVVTASYNNEQWVEQYFTSLIQQEYANWSLIYIDDCSTDTTLARIQQLARAYHIEDRVTIIANAQRKGHLYNQYHAIHACDPQKIIIIVDGDDWLSHNRVFATLNAAYQTHDAWITYGQFLYWKKNKKGFCRPIPADIIAKNGIRTISWRTSHLRSFYAGLFQKIKLEDLLWHGSFLPKCADVATMFPMIEMAGIHSHFITDILYIYNDDNPLSYHHDPTHQRELEAYLRTLAPYEPLKEKLW